MKDSPVFLWVELFCLFICGQSRSPPWRDSPSREGPCDGYFPSRFQIARQGRGFLRAVNIIQMLSTRTTKSRVDMCVWVRARRGKLKRATARGGRRAEGVSGALGLRLARSRTLALLTWGQLASNTHPHEPFFRDTLPLTDPTSAFSPDHFILNRVSRLIVYSFFDYFAIATRAACLSRSGPTPTNQKPSKLKKEK